MKNLASYLLLTLMLSFSVYSQAYRESYADGMKAIKFKKYDLAIDNFKEAIRLNPQYKDAWYYLGKTYDFLNRNEAAIDAFRNLEKIDSDYNYGIYYDIAKAYIELEIGTCLIG